MGGKLTCGGGGPIIVGAINESPCGRAHASREQRDTPEENRVQETKAEPSRTGQEENDQNRGVCAACRMPMRKRNAQNERPKERETTSKRP